MGITWTTSVFRTPPGLLKIAEFILVMIVLFITRFGHRGYAMMMFGGVDANFLGNGTVVAYAIIVPAVLLSYMVGANLSILELFINLVGGILYLAIGSVAIQTYSRYGYDNRMGSRDTIGIALGSLAIITGILFIIDFLFAFKNTFTFQNSRFSRFTYVQTQTRVVL